MVKVLVSYQGDLRSIIRHQENEEVITTDSPTVLHGRGEHFSPTDLVTAGVGSCIAATIGAAARHRKIDLTGFRINVEKIMGRNPAGPIKGFEIHIHMPGSYSDKIRRIFERSAAACPVMKSLHPDIQKDVYFHYRTS